MHYYIMALDDSGCPVRLQVQGVDTLQRVHGRDGRVRLQILEVSEALRQADVQMGPAYQDGPMAAFRHDHTSPFGPESCPACVAAMDTGHEEDVRREVLRTDLGAWSQGWNAALAHTPPWSEVHTQRCHQRTQRQIWDGLREDEGGLRCRGGCEVPLEVLPEGDRN